MLSARIQLRVVCGVIVALREEELRFCAAMMSAGCHGAGTTGAKEEETHPPPLVLTTRCTIGISGTFPLTSYTTISPTSATLFSTSPHDQGIYSVGNRLLRFQRNKRSPRWKAGSMLPERTTTMGLWESESMERDFQSMKAVERTRRKFRDWVRRGRGEESWEVREGMVVWWVCGGWRWCGV